MALAKPVAKKPVAKAAPKTAPKVAPKTAPKAAPAKVSPEKIGIKELALLVSDKIPVGRAAVERVITATFEEMALQFAAGKIVNIKDFGKLLINDRPERMARNPKTGEQIKVAAKRVPKFTFAKKMKERV